MRREKMVNLMVNLYCTKGNSLLVITLNHLYLWDIDHSRI